jgi:hypothetical protein
MLGSSPFVGADDLVFIQGADGIAEGDAQDIDGVFAVALDFERDGMSRFDGSKMPIDRANAAKIISNG